MEGDVGMSVHEKERKQEDAYTKTQTHPYIFVSFKSTMYSEDVFSLPNAFTTNKQNSEQRCRDGVMNEFESWCRHLLVSFLFHALTSLHPPSFDFSTCTNNSCSMSVEQVTAPYTVAKLIVNTFFTCPSPFVLACNMIVCGGG